MRLPVLGLSCLVAFALTVLVGCRADATATPAPTPPPLRPGRVVGTVAPRPGLVLAPALTLQVVIDRGWTDQNQVLAVHSLGRVASWPATFDVTVDWPNVPTEEVPVWKGLPPDLRVFARVYVDGRLAYLSEPRWYTVGDSEHGRLLGLVLVPAVE